MKTLIGLFLAALLSVTMSVSAQATPAHEHHGHQAVSAETGGSHACPMHPEVTGKAGDNCPKCGMDLEAKHTHKCPMHPQVTGVAGDSCPDCGMDLEPVGAAKGEHCANCPKKSEHNEHH